MEVVTNYSETDSPQSQRDAFYDISNKYCAFPGYDDVINAFCINSS